MEKPKKNRKKLALVIAAFVVFIVAVLAVCGYLFLKQTYSQMELLDTYTECASDNSNYIYFSKCVLKYSRDGVALFNKKGEELWNHPCQMQSPIVELCGEAAVIGDRGATSVMVLTTEGVKGEFQTSRPIERLTVSAQGIVGAVLKDETTPWILCYDAKGNVLVEQKASLSNTGYPIDIAISKDGKTLLAAYLFVKENSVSTKVTYYNFDEGTTEHEVASKTYADTMIPTTAFLDESTSVLVGDNAVVFWKGVKNPEESVKIDINQEIKSVAYDRDRVVLVLKNPEKSGYELRVYDKNGKQTATQEFEGEYGNIKVTGRRVILYEGAKCLIFDVAGVIRYEGQYEHNIQEIFPLWGINKYMIVGAEGMQKVQLTK